MRKSKAKILTQNIAQVVWHRLPVRALMSALFLFAFPTIGVLTAFGVASDTQLDSLSRHNVIQSLELPAWSEAETGNERFYSTERVQRGDTVASLLQRLDVDDPAAFEFLRSDPAARSIYQLRPGRTLQAITDGSGELITLRYLNSNDTLLEVQRNGTIFSAHQLALNPEIVTERRTGVIKSSLFAAADEALIPDGVADQLARIFSTDIDFHIDLRRGDHFSVIYENLYQNGEFIRSGRVISAEFFNNGKKFEAFLFTDAAGNEAYYSADGQNRAKSFLRSPLAFTRVSSGFGGRLHPIFRNWRAHTGVDFAAPRGTPVWATADGIVEYAGVKGGYGNVLEIRHASGITTLYGHLSGFAAGVRRGNRVSQGQTVAYVGATGYATGPHLHYEFKIAGAHQDPMRVALPKAEPLSPRYRQQFQVEAAKFGTQLAMLRDARYGRFE